MIGPRICFKHLLKMVCFLLILSSALFIRVDNSTAIDESQIERNSGTFIESTQSSMSESVAAYDWESHYVYLSSGNVLIFDYTVSGGNINLHLLSGGQYSTWLSAGPFEFVPTLKSISSTSSGRLTYRSGSGGEYYLLFDNQASGSSKSISGTITKDTRAPNISCNLTHGQNYTSPVTIQITASDDESSVEQIRLKIDGETAATVNDETTLLYEWEVDWDESGNFTLEITARDGWDKVRTVNLNVSLYGGSPPSTPPVQLLSTFTEVGFLLLAVVIGLIYTRMKNRSGKPDQW